MACVLTNLRKLVAFRDILQPWSKEVGSGGNSSDLCSGGDQLESQSVFYKSVHANFVALIRPCPLLHPFQFIIH